MPFWATWMDGGCAKYSDKEAMLLTATADVFYSSDQGSTQPRSKCPKHTKAPNCKFKMPKIGALLHSQNLANVLNTACRNRDVMIIAENVNEMLKTEQFDLILCQVHWGQRLFAALQRAPLRPRVMMILPDSDFQNQENYWKDQGAWKSVREHLTMHEWETEVTSAATVETASKPSALFFPDMVGPSDKMQTAFLTMLRLRNKTPVLIIGEDGTGKRTTAKRLHLINQGPQKPFISARCGGLTPEEQESLIFGHEAGAFPWAVNRQAGRLELANEGTLFLDEIDHLASRVQEHLVMLLQDRRFCPLGSTRLLPSRSWLIAAADPSSLERTLNQQFFRSDLYHLLSAIEIKLPALRDRLNDIPALAAYFLKEIPGGHPGLQIDPKTEVALKEFSTWGGNVRQLRNVIESAAALCDAKLITPDHLPRYIRKQNKQDSSRLKQYNIGRDGADKSPGT